MTPPQFRASDFLTPAALLLLVLAAYGIALRNGFVFDDTATIVENVLLRDWRSWPKLFTQRYFVLSGEASYRPVVTLTYFLDYTLWDLNPAGYHLTNLLLHGLAVLLLWKFIAVALGAAPVAAWTAALFAAHPMLSETVNAISFREDALALVFMLAALLCLLGAYHGGRRRASMFVAGWLAAALALLSKEMAVTLPALALLTVWLRRAYRPRPTSDEQRRAVAIFITGVALLTATYLMLRFGPLQSQIELRQQLPAIGPLTRLLTSATMVLASTLQLLLPVGMSADYHAAFAGPESPLAWLALVLAVGALALLAPLWRRAPVLGFGLLWFVVAMAPVSNLVPLNHLKADRYLYVPAVGFCLVAASLLRKLPAALPATMPPKVAAALSPLLFALLLACFVPLSITRSLAWRNDASLWRGAASAAAPAVRPLHNLGLSFYKRRGYDEAHLLFLRALRAQPRSVSALTSLGYTFSQRGYADRALLSAVRALQLDPPSARAHTIAGVLVERRGRLPRALRHYGAAIALRPGFSQPFLNRGVVYFRMQRFWKALAAFRQAQFLQADDVRAAENVAATLYRLKLPEEALRAYRYLLRLQPRHAVALRALRLIEAQLERERSRGLR